MTSAQFVHRKIFFQHLLAGDKNKLRAMKESDLLNSEEECLITNYIFKEENTDSNLQLGLIIKGWTCYYNAQYEKSLNYFITSLDKPEGWESWSWLGIGKIASDWLDWQKAAGFLLQSLNIARDENDLVRMTECYGALGEVAFRSGNFQLAYELFSIDKALLIPGSYQYFRVANYLAICTSRLGHSDLASVSLKENYFASLKNDPVSSDYSLASLYVCALINEQEDRIKNLEKLLISHSFKAVMPQAFISLVHAWYQRNKDQKKCLNNLEKAAFYFSKHYPFEKVYIETLIASIKGQHVKNQVDCLSDRTKKLPDIPKRESLVLDSFIQETLYKDSINLYKMMLNTENNLWAICKFFFI